MTAIFVLLGLSLTIFSFGLTDFSAELGRSLQNFCQSLLPPSDYKMAYAAMACGQNLPSGILKNDLKQTGLLHLFVVSGSHLVFLCLILDYMLARTPWGKTRMARLFIALALVGYSLLTGFNPPVVRSLVAMGLRCVNMRQKLFWRPFDEILFSGILCLLIFPFWWASLSFLLSWLASLGLALGKGQLRQALWIYVLLLLPLAGLGLSDPFSVLLNWLVAPVLGFTLFPLSLLVMLCPPTVHLVDPIWAAVLWTLHPMAQWLGPTTILSSIPIFFCWLGLFILHFYWSTYLAQKRRESLIL